jgi:hypothetical protein
MRNLLRLISRCCSNSDEELKNDLEIIEKAVDNSLVIKSADITPPIIKETLDESTIEISTPLKEVSAFTEETVKLPKKKPKRPRKQKERSKKGFKVSLKSEEIPVAQPANTSQLSSATQEPKAPPKPLKGILKKR